MKVNKVYTITPEEIEMSKQRIKIFIRDLQEILDGKSTSTVEFLYKYHND